METESLVEAKPRLTVKVAHQDRSSESFAVDVLNGLSAEPKFLPPKYFYDAVGSRLFEEICELPEYYPTRTELSIIKEEAHAILRYCRAETAIIELGSGSSLKTRVLLEAFMERFHRLHYIPIDISKSMLVESAKSMLEDYRKLKITALASDYDTALSALARKNFTQKFILFLGSSVGNFNPDDRHRFLTSMRESMEVQDRLLIGIDLVKDKAVLEPAYDDADGVTARFNLNLLKRMNRELQADFDLGAFRHKAFYNPTEQRIEMHLESLRDQTVTFAALERSFRFKKGETIHTENSHKFTPKGIEKIAHDSGFAVEHSWYDPRQWFSLNLFKPE